jgi:hypothetical protein
MSEEFWLRCDKCGRSMDDAASEPMQLVVLFKPSLVSVAVPRTHERERRHRCRSCGWVNVFVPLVAISQPANSSLTPGWRDRIVTK